ncbi:RNB domain-containing ribonuclease [Gulosibacter faecalis]|uniref:RNB domain-containing ribonuclease n=1 Tax=Gulosibacter faecalis TaxID=272240 RepID=A0ABW5UUD8_9MICO|nr:RNB domain-containing ribonuclease [Gulosibacter faecalis]
MSERTEATPATDGGQAPESPATDNPESMADLNFDAIREKYEVTEAFSPELEREAADATDRFADDRLDARDLHLVTIDPPGSKDLDQAVRIERGTEHDRHGYTLYYAIADVGAFVAPGSPLDAEARTRGETKYLPDGSIPLYPRALTEHTASLVAGVDRPAVLWQIETDANGVLTRARVRRALVHVRERLDYPSLQSTFDHGHLLPEPIEALPEFGGVREERSRERGAVELQLPEQDLVRIDGRWQLRLEPRTRMDNWNSHCSLATGIAAARIMLAGGTGLLRTLPAPDADTVRQFRQAAHALGVETTDEQLPGEILASLDPTDPRALALNSAATKLLRGSGYLAFTPETDFDPEHDHDKAWHAGVASEYAHATAPIRRLGDRFVSEICLAYGGDWVALDGTARVTGEVPTDIVAALDELPGLLQNSGRIAGSIENECINLAEAVALQDAVGEEFDAGLLRGGDGDHHAEVFVTEPPVIAQCRGDVPAGEHVRVRLVEADVAKRRVRFEYPA